MRAVILHADGPPLPPREGDAAPSPPWGPLTTLLLALLVGLAALFLQNGVVRVWLDLESRHPLRLAFPPSDGNLLALAVLSSSPLVLLALLALCRLRRGWSSHEYLALRRFSLRQFLPLVALQLLLLAAGDAALLLVNGALSTPFERQVLATAHPVVPLLLAMTLAAPLQEELLFRGFLLRGLRSSSLGGMGAIVVTSALWVLPHTQYGPLVLGLLFIEGIFLGWARVHTRSLWVPILLHGALNAISATQVLWMG